MQPSFCYIILTIHNLFWAVIWFLPEGLLVVTDIYWQDKIRWLLQLVSEESLIPLSSLWRITPVRPRTCLCAVTWPWSMSSCGEHMSSGVRESSSPVWEYSVNWIPVSRSTFYINQTIWMELEFNPNSLNLDDHVESLVIRDSKHPPGASLLGWVWSYTHKENNWTISIIFILTELISPLNYTHKYDID